MTDCGDLGNCAIPMWVQYLMVVVAMLMLALKCWWPRDPYDRM
jgi:hypothetical protein